MLAVKKLLSIVLLLSLLLPPRLFSQTIEENLSTLENLIDNSISSIENTEQDNEALRQILENWEASLKAQSLRLTEQGILLNEQEANYTRQRQIYETQKKYLETSLFKSKIYKWSLIIAVPICTGLGAWLGWTLARQ